MFSECIMSDEIVLPRRMTTLGEALVPLERNLRSSLDASVATTAPVGSMIEIAKEHFDKLQSVVHRLSDRVDGLMSDIISKDDASDSDVYRAVGRFESVLDELQSGYRDVRRLAARGDDIEARDLLAGVYRHALKEIHVWIMDVISVMADPAAALRARGLPTSGNIELPLTLTMTSAPQLQGLKTWIQRKANSSWSGSSKRPGFGFWGTLGALWLGWEIGEHLFGGHHHCDDHRNDV